MIARVSPGHRWNSPFCKFEHHMERGLGNEKSMITRFCCYKAVVRLEPTKPASMKAWSSGSVAGAGTSKKMT